MIACQALALKGINARLRHSFSSIGIQFKKQTFLQSAFDFKCSYYTEIFVLYGFH